MNFGEQGMIFTTSMMTFRELEVIKGHYFKEIHMLFSSIDFGIIVGIMSN